MSAIARKALEDRLTFTYLKSGGRALMKSLATEKAKAELNKRSDEVANSLGSMAVDLSAAVTGRADMRGWRTLSGEFQLARLNLLPG